METKEIKLLAGATNIEIIKSTDKETVIHYNCIPLYPDKKCVYIVPGKWEIQSIAQNKVTLVNYNETIK